MIDHIRKEIQRALSGVRGAVRGVLKNLSLDTRIQRANVEALSGEQLEDVELFQQFGLASAPPDGSQVILIPLGGRTSATVIVATEHGSYRLKLDNKGESGLYNQWGDYVHLKKGGIAEVKVSTRADVICPLVTFSGDVNVAGTLHVASNITTDANITAAGDIADQSGTKTMAGMRAAYTGHDHSNPEGGRVGPANPGM